MKVRTWSEIAFVSGDAAARAAIAALAEAEAAGSWLASVGQPSPRDVDVVRVSSWPDALRIFHGNPACNTNGTLSTPLEQVIDFAEKHFALYTPANAAAHSALDALSFSSSIPPELSIDDNVAVGDYFTEFVRFLFLEIYVGDRLPAPSTYFRDQLGWFLAGYLPCGWEGEWPAGRLRVF